MLASFTLRARYVIAALVVGIVLASIALYSSGAFASTKETPVVAGVPLAAQYNEPIPAYANYRGWGYVAYGNGGSAGFAALRAVPIDAWRWSDYYGWRQSSRTVGTQVYIYPYASGWSWTWTEGTGWLAMRTSNLEIGYRPVAVAT